MSKQPFDLDRLFEGSLSRLRIEAEYFSRLSAHKGELGRLNEVHLMRLLREYLPPKIGVGTGFVVCGGEESDQSAQCDIVLYDAVNNAPFYVSETWSVYPIEMVYAVIEVKTVLTKAELRKAFVTNAKLRGMAQRNGGNKAYVSSDPSRQRARLPSRFFVFAYGGLRSVETLRRKFAELASQHGAAHLHGVCCLTKHDSFFVSHIAWRAGEHDVVEQNGFRYFMLKLPPSIDTMLPSWRQGLGFDRVDLSHYGINLRTPSGTSD